MGASHRLGDLANTHTINIHASQRVIRVIGPGFVCIHVLISHPDTRMELQSRHSRFFSLLLKRILVWVLTGRLPAQADQQPDGSTKSESNTDHPRLAPPWMDLLNNQP